MQMAKYEVYAEGGGVSYQCYALPPTPQPNQSDTTIWLPSPRGVYTAKLALQQLSEPCNHVPWFNLV